MSNQERILQAIYSAVDEINEQLPKGKALDKSPETVLFGKSGKLDSLGLVSLIVAVEQNIHDEFGVDITLADERAMSQQNSPFKSVKTLSDYVAVLLADNESSSH
jgi:acyl carrier protein